MNKTSYSDNLISGKIRQLLRKNPKAGYDELFRMFGYVSRSIRITYYKIYKEMFNKPGSLRRKISRPAPIRDKVVEYFTKHPDHTITDGARTLNMSEIRVYNTLYNASIDGFKVTFKKRLNKKNGINISEEVRKYMKKHPKATSRECAKAIGAKTNYVSLVRYRNRKYVNQEEK